MASCGSLGGFMDCSLNREDVQGSLNNCLFVLGADWGEDKSFKEQ